MAYSHCWLLKPQVCSNFELKLICLYTTQYSVGTEYCFKDLARRRMMVEFDWVNDSVMSHCPVWFTIFALPNFFQKYWPRWLRYQKQKLTWRFNHSSRMLKDDYQNLHHIAGYIVNVLFSLQAPKTSYRNNKRQRKQQDAIPTSHQP